MTYLRALALLLWLAACGGASGGGGGGVDPRLARLDVYAAQNLRVLGDPALGVPAMTATPGTAMPAGGTVDFAGAASIRIEAPDAPLVLFGDAAITLDFDLGAVNGTVSNVFGDAHDEAIADYTGQLQLTGGAPSQALSVKYSGTLVAGTTTLGFDGGLSGELLGNPLGALAIADLEATIDQNGTMRSGVLIIIAEDVPPPATPPVQ